MNTLRWRYVVSALRMWRHHRLQALLSVLGVIAGVSGLVTVMAVGQGAQRELQRAIGLLGAGTMVVRSIVEHERDAGITVDRVQAVRRIFGSELRSLVPISTVQRDLLAGDRYLEGVKVIGTDRDYEDAFRLRLHRGRFITWFDIERAERVCVLGWSLARELFPQGQPVGRQVRVGRDWYTVVGWLQADARADVDIGDFDLPDVDRAVYVPVTTVGGAAGRISLDELVLSFADEADMIRASGAVQRILEFDADGAAFEYTMPIELLRQKLRMQRVIRYLLGGITAVMLAVGGIGIMNIMLVNVIRRRPEIGLRRAVGATRRDILTQFVTESTLVAVAGGVAGTIVGAVAAFGVSAMFDWPVVVGAGTLGLGLLVSAVVGICFGSYPAMQAASVTPIRTLNQL
ncbi:MAG: ABC transporter permease [Gammaproteobacteria bacterium]